MKVNKEDKWLLISCLQKSIRKGFTELALNFANKLYELENAYLVYRLSQMAIEDIGIANVNLVHDFLSTELKKEAIEERGGKKYVLSLVEQLSESVKDRSASDLLALAMFYQERRTFDRSHVDIFLDDKELVVNRVLASWEILGGKKLKNPLISNTEESNINKFIEINKRIVPDERILDIIKWSYNIHKEPYFISIGLLSYLFDKELQKQVKVGKFETGDFVYKKYPTYMIQNKWLIDGVDWHTKEGKSAIFDFCLEKTEVNEYLKSMMINPDEIETLASIIAMLLFRQNGQQVDKRIVYPSAIVILKLTEQLLFRQIIENNSADFFKAVSLFEKDIPLLNKLIESKFTVADPKYFPF